MLSNTFPHWELGKFFGWCKRGQGEDVCVSVLLDPCAAQAWRERELVRFIASADRMIQSSLFDICCKTLSYCERLFFWSVSLTPAGGDVTCDAVCVRWWSTDLLLLRWISATWCWCLWWPVRSALSRSLQKQSVALPKTSLCTLWHICVKNVSTVKNTVFLSLSLSLLEGFVWKIKQPPCPQMLRLLSEKK